MSDGYMSFKHEFCHQENKTEHDPNFLSSKLLFLLVYQFTKYFLFGVKLSKKKSIEHPLLKGKRDFRGEVFSVGIFIGG